MPVFVIFAPPCLSFVFLSICGKSGTCGDLSGFSRVSCNLTRVATGTLTRLMRVSRVMARKFSNFTPLKRAVHLFFLRLLIYLSFEVVGCDRTHDGGFRCEKTGCFAFVMVARFSGLSVGTQHCQLLAFALLHAVQRFWPMLSIAENLTQSNCFSFFSRFFKKSLKIARKKP